MIGNRFLLCCQLLLSCKQKSWSGQGLNSTFLSDMKRLAPGDHHVSYTAYIKLDLINDGGSKVHTKYLILEKTLNFTI